MTTPLAASGPTSGAYSISQSMGAMGIRPPLGIMPCDTWKEHRALELAAAIERQREHYHHPGVDYMSQLRCLANIKAWAAEIVALDLKT